MSSVRRRLEVLRRLAGDPRTPQAERRAAEAAIAAWEAKLGDEPADALVPASAPARPRALPSGPMDAVVLVFDRAERAVTDRRQRGQAYTLSIVEVTALGEKHVLGRWLTTVELEWPDADLYVGFFGQGSAAAGDRVAAMSISVSDQRVLRKLFDQGAVMSMFVDTAEHGLVYFGRARITEIDPGEHYYDDTYARIVALDEATRVAGLEPDAAELPGGERRSLAATTSRPKLVQAKTPALPPGEPGLDDDE